MDERAYNRRQLKNFGMCMAGYAIMLRYLVRGRELKFQHRAEVLAHEIAEVLVEAAAADREQ